MTYVECASAFCQPKGTLLKARVTVNHEAVKIIALWCHKDNIVKNYMRFNNEKYPTKEDIFIIVPGRAVESGLSPPSERRQSFGSGRTPGWRTSVEEHCVWCDMRMSPLPCGWWTCNIGWKQCRMEGWISQFHDTL